MISGGIDLINLLLEEKFGDDLLVLQQSVPLFGFMLIIDGNVTSVLRILLR